MSGRLAASRVSWALLLVPLAAGCQLIFGYETVRDQGSERGFGESRPLERGSGESRPPDATDARDTRPVAGDARAVDAGRDAASCAGLVCPLGCSAGLGRCYRLLPANGGPAVKQSFDVAGLGAHSFAGSLYIDTDTGEISGGVRPASSPGLKNGIYWQTVDQGGYPKLSVFVFRSVTVGPGAQVTVKGSAALAIYATETVAIAGTGTVVAAANGSAPGAGGQAGSQAGQDAPLCDGGGGKKGADGSPLGSSADGGGGGGGRKAKGGDGFGDATVPGGKGGAVVSAVSPLFGGCGGGGGGPNDNQQATAGGGGGGAIQISANVKITVSGTISVPGGGGEGASLAGGAGGGSGGVILLEAPLVVVQAGAMLAANGGGGGGVDGTAGDPGTATTARATGGGGTIPGHGGQGGALGNEEGDTGTGDVYPNGGGGGGAAGWIRLSASSAPTVAGSASPQWLLGPKLSTF